MDAVLVSALAVSLAEIGDKTQLLALMLAARYRHAWPIVLGILTASLASHSLAGALGAWLATWMDPLALRWLVGLSFMAMSAWMLVPDRAPAADDSNKHMRVLGIFGVTLSAFLLAEMGDKTQLATVALAGRYEAFLPVVAGATLGMMIANVPVVLLGAWILERVPIRLVRGTAAVLFMVLGVATLFGAIGS